MTKREAGAPAALFTFDAFVPGANYGAATFAITTEEVDGWRRLFPDAVGVVIPASMTSAVVMNAYRLLINRPASLL
ncbi:MAG: hypothetical protein EA385_01385 [Salinarimonadaceae bacterium]|nr:MAG: hypothetical protein EA385_01385 [Salinarimonadaceae bacterium]